MKLCDIVLNKILICDTTAHTGYFWIIYRSKIGFLIGCEILQQYHFRRNNNNNNNKNRWFEWRWFNVQTIIINSQFPPPLFWCVIWNSAFVGMVTLAMAAAQERRRQPVADRPEEEQDYATLARAGGRKGGLATLSLCRLSEGIYPQWSHKIIFVVLLECLVLYGASNCRTQRAVV